MAEPLKFRVRATARKAIVVALPRPVAGVTPDDQHGALITAAPDKVRVRAVQRPRAVAVRSPERAAAAVSGTGERVILVPTQGVPGPPGPAGSELRIDRHTDIVLNGHRAVVPDGAGVAYADSSNPTHNHDPVWLTTDAWTAGSTASLLADGQTTEPSWNWTLNEPIFLGLNGTLTQTVPPSAVFIRQIAEVIDAQTIMFRPQLPITRG